MSHLFGILKVQKTNPRVLIGGVMSMGYVSHLNKWTTSSRLVTQLHKSIQSALESHSHYSLVTTDSY